MKTFFGPDFFSANRTRLRSLLKSDMPIIITGNGQMQRGADEPFTFLQDSSFWYLTGINSPDLTLIIDKNETHLIVPGRSVVREAFDGMHDIAHYSARSGITSILNETDGWELVKRSLAGGHTAVLGAAPPYMKHHGIYTLPYRRRLITKLRRLQPALAFRDIRTELAGLRCLKQPEELAAIQAAINITTATLQTVSQAEVLKPAQHEYQLEAAITYNFRSRGADGHAFSPIVGAGAHTTTLHHVDNNGPVEASDLIVLDIGAAVEHYSADITRTVSKQPITGRKAGVFNAVAGVQDFALNLLRPGILPADYEQAIETRMGQELRKLGLIKTDKSADIRRYFPHSTSHFLGLDTHDAGDYRQPYQAGMVITCEPGIYIPEEGIGVRLEDDVLITKTGCKVLSAACPRELTPVQ